MLIWLKRKRTFLFLKQREKTLSLNADLFFFFVCNVRKELKYFSSRESVIAPQARHAILQTKFGDFQKILITPENI